MAEGRGQRGFRPVAVLSFSRPLRPLGVLPSSLARRRKGVSARSVVQPAPGLRYPTLAICCPSRARSGPWGCCLPPSLADGKACLLARPASTGPALPSSDSRSAGVTELTESALVNASVEERNDEIDAEQHEQSG